MASACVPSQPNSRQALPLRRPSLCVPYVQCQAWAVAEPASGEVVMGKYVASRREVASITKVMTCLVVLRHVQHTRLGLHSLVPVSARASAIGGTSAHLKGGERLRLIDLLHGLMLPSGNDAALCLAEFCGARFAEEYEETHHDPVLYFVNEMNLLAEELELDDTVYRNPHGLSKPKNLSSARDICRLAAAALQYEDFARIVATQSYHCDVILPNGHGTRMGKWKNTNELLGAGFSGIKTGITRNAGPCLCALYTKEDQQVIVVVLGASTRERRWIDVPKLAEWGVNYLSRVSTE